MAHLRAESYRRQRPVGLDTHRLKEMGAFISSSIFGRYEKMMITIRGGPLYLWGPAGKVVSAWEPYVRNFAPNLGNDYGGRLTTAWLDREAEPAKYGAAASASSTPARAAPRFPLTSVPTSPTLPR